MTKYYVDDQGAYIGGFDGVEPPAGAIEVPSAPDDARQPWTGEGWGPVPVTVADVITERDRRLALGFDYDFGDVRGIHRIGTTPEDRRGWQEVTDAANAAIAVGQSSAEFVIATDTGSATITAMEWQQILIAATAHRQPIWQASFALQAMDPIPADYADDKHWPA